MSKHQTNVDVTDEDIDRFILDSKLKIILREMECAGKYGDAHATTYDQLIAQTKQAFADAGYVHVNASQETQAAIANTMLGHKVITGAEWYNRYQRQLKGKPIPHETEDGHVVRTLLVCQEAAKRAAGLVEGDE